MHCEAGPPHWKLMQIQKLRKTRGRMDIWTDEHITLPLRGFYPVACGRMICTKLRAAHFYCQKSMRKNGKKYRDTDIEAKHIHINKYNSIRRGIQCGESKGIKN